MKIKHSYNLIVWLMLVLSAVLANVGKPALGAAAAAGHLSAREWTIKTGIVPS